MIRERVKKLLNSIPQDVVVVAAVKKRSVKEVQLAYEAGLRIFGHNYVQEAQDMIGQLGFRAEWHMIGHLQRNKVNAALQLFEVIETVDSPRLAVEIERRAAQMGKEARVLVEINSGCEENKSGVFPENVDALIHAMQEMAHVRVEGLMTMGPLLGDPELARPYYVETRKIYERLKDLPAKNIQMRYLSMGMSNSYQVAIEEGANMIRIGTLIFGERN